MLFFFQNNNIHSSPTPWVKQPGSASTAESPILAPRRRLESVESAAKFLTEALPNNNMTGYCKKTFSLNIKRFLIEFLIYNFHKYCCESCTVQVF